jgi:hypothetical protein
MYIYRLPLEKLYNEEHFEFLSEFNGLIIRFDPVRLQVADLYNHSYLPLYAKEDEAFMFIRKSSHTEKLAVSDHIRDQNIIGITHLVDSYAYHFRPEIVDAANRLDILLARYGHIAKKSYDKETADINNLLQELRGDYAQDVDLLNFRDWVDELDAANRAFEDLRSERYAEAAKKTEVRMQSIRLEINEVYRVIVDQINARMTIEGEEQYLPFVKELNLRIDHYKNLVAQRRGRSNTNKETPMTK